MSDNLFFENKNLNRREIEQRKSVLESKVTSLVVTLTTKCNISCIMCEEKKIPWDIPQRTIKETIALFPYLEEIIWQGGEVLILDYFKDFLKEASKYRNLHQSIITNGLVISEDLAPLLVRDNIELTFSIDAPDKKLYEAIRRKASFGILLENIKLVNLMRKEKKLDNMSFRMHVVIMKSNYQQLEKFIDFAKEHEFDALHFMPIWGNYDGEENIFYRKNDQALSYIKENIARVEEKAREYRLNLLNSLPFSGNSKPERDEAKTQERGLLCHMPWRRMVINPAGNVCPACHCKQMVGNVADETLEEIWNNRKMQAYRQKIAHGRCTDLCNPDCIRGIISEELRGLK
jgi:MoaA/NifB/PqqE/SkfB family radical SAM enzyme